MISNIYTDLIKIWLYLDVKFLNFFESKMLISFNLNSKLNGHKQFMGNEYSWPKSRVSYQFHLQK